MHAHRPDAEVPRRGDGGPDRRRHGRDAGRRAPPPLPGGRDPGRRRRAPRRGERRREPRLPRGAGRLRRSALPGEPRHLHAGPVRRARGPRHRRRRRAALERDARAGEPHAAQQPGRRRRSRAHRQLGDRGARGAARGAGVLHPGGHRRAVRHRLEGSPQLQPDGRPADRPQAALGPQGRRRSGAAPVEHPRQRLRDRHARLHRRHARHPRPRRSQPGRLRLPGDDHRGRALEDRPAQGGRHRPVRRRVDRGGAAAEARAGGADRARDAPGPARATVARAARRDVARRRQSGRDRRARAPRADGGRARGGDPARRRRGHPRRVRSARPRAGSALPRSRADRSAGRQEGAGDRRSDAGHSLAAGPLRRRAPAARAAAGAAGRDRGGPARDGPDRGRVARSSTCRSPGTTRRRSSRSAST